jgi:hypothetical protein
MNSTRETKDRQSSFYVAIVVVVIIATGLVIVLANSLTNDSRNTTPKNGAVLTIDSLYPEYSLVEMVEHSQTVVVGKVIGVSEPFMVAPVLNGDPRYFTDYYFEINRVLYGNQTRAGTTISVRTLGGGNNVFTVESEHSPNLAVNSELMLFLFQKNDGLDYNTQGDHFYILNEKQGSCVADDIDYIERVQAAVTDVGRETPLSADEIRQNNLDSLNNRYKIGEIDKEEYSQFLLEFEQFARVLTPDEVAAYEARVLEQLQQNMERDAATQR